MSKTIRFTDPGQPVVIIHNEDGGVVIGRDFRFNAKETVQLPPGHQAIVELTDGKVRLYAAEGEDYGDAQDIGFRLRFGPPAVVRWIENQQPVTWEDAVRWARSGEANSEARPPVEFDVAAGMPPTLAGQVYQWLTSLGAEVELIQEP